MTNELCFGQRIDPELGILEPWYTNPAMDKIKTWDLSDKVVLEYGGGASSWWWAYRCKKVVTIESNPEWFTKIADQSIQNDCQIYGSLTRQNDPIVLIQNKERTIDLTVILKQINEGDQIKGMEYVLAYLEEPMFAAIKPDIVVVDGIMRTECCQAAVDLLSEKGGICICDNWHQDYVWISPKAEEIMYKHTAEIYSQPNHTNFENEGCEWKTAIFKIIS